MYFLSYFMLIPFKMHDNSIMRAIKVINCPLHVHGFTVNFHQIELAFCTQITHMCTHTMYMNHKVSNFGGGHFGKFNNYMYMYMYMYVYIHVFTKTRPL